MPLARSVGVCLHTGTAIAALALVFVWPTLALLLAAGVGLAAVARVRPEYAFVVAVCLFAVEGSIKVRLGSERLPVEIAPDAAGALFLDAAFLVALVGLLMHDRGRSVRGVWSGAPGFARAGLVLLGGWLVLSLLQIPQTGDLEQGILGFRLSQAYLVAALAGATVLSLGVPRWRTLGLLVGLCGLVAAYAALRTLIGPATSERIFALSQQTTSVIGEGTGGTFRAIGSFSGAIGLASFLVPAGVFALALGLAQRLRPLAWPVTILAVVGALGSYVRASLVAIAAGGLLAVALVTAGRGLSIRRRLAAAVAGLAVLGIGVGVTSLAFSGSENLREKGRGLVHPLSDDAIRIRLRAAEDSLSTAAEHPFGTGVGTVGHAAELSGRPAPATDNSYLKTLREQGVPGALLFVGGLLLLSVALARRSIQLEGDRRIIGVAALSGFAASLVLALAWESIEQPGKVLAWTLLGIAGWAAWGSEPRNRAAEDAGKRDGWSAEGVPRAALVALVALLTIGPMVLSATRAGAHGASLPLTVVGSSGESETPVEYARRLLVRERVRLRDETLRPNLVDEVLLANESLIDRAEVLPGSTRQEVRLRTVADTPDRARVLANQLGARLGRASRRRSAGGSIFGQRALVAGLRAESEPLSRRADRLVAGLPGPFPPDPGLAWAGIAALLVASLGVAASLSRRDSGRAQ